MKKLFLSLAVIISAVLFASCGGNGPETVAKKALDAQIARDYKTVIDLSYFENDGKEMTQEDRDALLELYQGFDEMVKEEDRMTAYKLGETVMAEDGNSAEIKYIETTAKGDEEKTMKMIKHNDEWLVDSGK